MNNKKNKLYYYSLFVITFSMLFPSCTDNKEHKVKETYNTNWADNISLLEFISSECLENCDISKFQNKVLSKKLEHNTLEIKIATIKDCCIEFTPAIYKENEYLQIFTDTREGLIETCVCDCPFELTFKIDGVKSTHFKTQLDWKDIP